MQQFEEQKKKTEVNQQSLLILIDKVNKLLKEFDEQNKKGWQVIMLVGNTGNGKSTIFNYLCGYEFKISMEGCFKNLELKDPNQNGASKMKGGSLSITREPHYFLNQNNKHILIDFPGFCDTGSQMAKNAIQILFNRIVTKTPVKIVYVVKQPDNEFNSRGEELKKFISGCFVQNNVEFKKIVIILNSYMDELNENQLRNYLKNNMVEIKDNKDIAVIRKIKTENDLKNLFNKDIRDKIWKIIENSQPLQFQTSWMKVNLEIAYYINKKILDITNQIVKEISMSIKNDFQNLQILDMEDVVKPFIKIRKLIGQKMQNQNIYQWYRKLMINCLKIADIYKVDYEKLQQVNNILKIFNFFAQEDDIIKTRQLLLETKNYIRNQLISQEELLTYLFRIKVKEERNWFSKIRVFFYYMGKEQELEDLSRERERERQIQKQNKNQSSSCSIF